MNDHCLTTWEILKRLGFAEDESVISDPPGGLSFDFGNVKLEASHCVNARFVEVVLLTGVIVTPRRAAGIYCEIPLKFESQEQAEAWVVWCLDKSSGGTWPSNPKLTKAASCISRRAPANFSSDKRR